MIPHPTPGARWLDVSGPPPDAIADALLGVPGADAKLEPLARAGAGRGGPLALRAVLGSGEVLFVKRFPARRRILHAVALLLRRDAAHREWRALRRLAGARVPVPEPRALGRLAGGDLVLVTGFCAGPTLAAALAAGAQGRALAAVVGSAVARLHAAGFVHGDLHAGQVVLSEAGPVLADLRAARRSRSRRARRRDAAALERSVARRLRLVDRVRLRAAALGLRRPFGRGARRELRAVARIARALGLAHARARMRGVGRRSALARVGALRGLRAAALAPETLALAVEVPRGVAPARRRVRWVRIGDQRVVVKEFAPGLRGAIVDLARGSPARRAWRAGSGLAALGIGVAAPLAFLERRRLGVPVASVLVQEDLCPAPGADSPGPDASPAERVDALTRLARDLHGAGAAHRDFTAANVLLVRGAHGLSGRLVDLEDARIPRRLGDAARLRGLAQMNASLPEWIPDPLRWQALSRYAAWLPFRAPIGRVTARIASASRAREHHWSGAGCVAERSAGPPLKSPRS